MKPSIEFGEVIGEEMYKVFVDDKGKKHKVDQHMLSADEEQFPSTHVEKGPQKRTIGRTQGGRASPGSNRVRSPNS
jgi:hypothetical protein